MARVLVVEDDLEISEPLVRTLQSEGHSVATVADGGSAIDMVHRSLPDLIILDLGLPTIDGLEVCRTLRAGGFSMPILMLTARTSELDLVVGLDAGADDYLMKPFRSTELLARIRALLRRIEGHAPSQLTSDSIVLNRVAHTVSVNDEPVALTSREYELLELLMVNVGRLVTRQQILRDLWNTEWVGSTKNLDMHVSALRRKLGDSGKHISTVRGVGFRFDPEQ